MQVHVGDTVQLRDGRMVLVTDATYLDPSEYVLEDPETGKFEAFKPETIFLGNLVRRAFGTRVTTAIRVVSDMSEVVSIIE